MRGLKRNIVVVMSGLLTAAAMPAQALDIGAMGNVNYFTSSEKGANDSFELGAFDIFGNQQIDPNTRVFFEYVLEDGGEGMGVDLERAFISRKLTPSFELSAGRYHTPLGYWNRTYHHGAIMSDTVDRPGFLEFEDASSAVLPMHIIGVSGVGNIVSSVGKWTYELALGNSSSLDSSSFGTPGARSEIGLPNVGDLGDKKAAVTRVIFEPAGVPMHFAVFGMHESYAEAGDAGTLLPAGSTLVSQRVLGFDTRYATPQYDITAEYFNIRNDAHAGVGDGDSHTGTAYYAQFGYKITDVVKGIYRFESLDFDQDDPYFQLLASQRMHKHGLGVRYDLDDSNTFKVEIDREEPKGGGKSDTKLEVQWAFMLL